MELVRRLVNGQSRQCFLELNKKDKGFLHVRTLQAGSVIRKIPVCILAYNVMKRSMAIEMLGEVFHLRIVNVGSNLLSVSLLGNKRKAPVVVSVAADRQFAGARRDHSVKIKPVVVSSAHDKKYTLSSPLVGRVVRLFVKEGDFVKKGSQLISIESMKMENVLYAHDDLFIKSILISEADVVQTNEGLMIFDEKRGYDECSTKSSAKKEV